MYPDGLLALARYAGLEVLEARTQWEDLPEYDNESNKWHDSVSSRGSRRGASSTTLILAFSLREKAVAATYL